MEQLYEIQYEFEKALLTIDRVKSNTIFENIINKINNKEYITKVIEKIVVISLKHIKDGWKEGRISLAQVYMSAAICDELVSSFISCIDSNIDTGFKYPIDWVK